MTEQGILLLCCMALPVLIIGIGVKFHRAYNRQVMISKSQSTKH
jgi:hypothetical protein